MSFLTIATPVAARRLFLGQAGLVERVPMPGIPANRSKVASASMRNRRAAFSLRPAR